MAINHYHETLGEALLGVELDFSGMQMQFKGVFVIIRVIYANLSFRRRRQDSVL